MFPSPSSVTAVAPGALGAVVPPLFSLPLRLGRLPVVPAWPCRFCRGCRRGAFLCAGAARRGCAPCASRPQPAAGLSRCRSSRHRLRCCSSGRLCLHRAGRRAALPHVQAGSAPPVLVRLPQAPARFCDCPSCAAPVPVLESGAARPWAYCSTCGETTSAPAPRRWRRSRRPARPAARQARLL